MADLHLQQNHPGSLGKTGARSLVAGALAIAALMLAAAPAAASPLTSLGRAGALATQLVGSTSRAAAEKKLNAASAALFAASDPTLWIEPSDIVAPPYGKRVFTDTRQAVHELRSIRSKSVASSSLRKAIALAVGAARGAASAAIEQAASGDPMGVASAQRALLAGNAAWSSGHPATAVGDYRRAWTRAFAVLTRVASAAATSIPAADVRVAAKNVLASPVLSVATPKLLTRQPLLMAGRRPVLFAVLWEFCPYCATESWGLVAALSRFGSFHHLALISSDPTDDGFSVAGFTFYKATYQSRVLKLETVEQYSPVPIEQFGPGPPTGPPYQPLQSLTPAEQQLFNTYDTLGGVPFLDFANVFTTTGSSAEPGDLRGLDWAQIAADLRDPTTTAGEAVAGTAEMLTAQICEVTGERPASVCDRAIVHSFEHALDGATSGGYCPASASPSSDRRRPPVARAARCSV